jgi:hypothetical protein
LRIRISVMSFKIVAQMLSPYGLVAINMGTGINRDINNIASTDRYLESDNYLDFNDEIT